MHLKGNFEPASLTTVLQMLSNDCKTGLLRLTGEENDVRIFFKDGTVIYARGTAQETALGQLLVNKGVITQGQLDQCLEESAAKKQALGNILVKQGHLGIKSLKKHIANQAEEVIYSVFFWEQGRFDYTDSELLPPGVLVTHLDIMNILLEATRRIDEVAVLKKQLPGDDVVLKTSGMPPDSVRLSPVEWRFLSLVDGKRKIREIVKESGYDAFSVYKMLHSLLSLRLVEKDEQLASLAKAYGPVMKQYRLFWNVVRKELEKELGTRTFMIKGSPPPTSPSKRKDFIKHLRETELWKWITNILDRAKPQEGEFYRLFSGIHMDAPLTKTQEWVYECLSDRTAEEGARILGRGYRLQLENLLKRLPSLIGGFRTLDVISGLTLSLTQRASGGGGLTPKQSDEVQAIFAMASQRIAEQLNNEEEKIFGVFVVKNRKYLG